MAKMPNVLLRFNLRWKNSGSHSGESGKIPSENMKMKRYRISNRATFWKQVKSKIIVETFRLLREMSIGFRRIKKEAMVS